MTKENLADTDEESGLITCLEKKLAAVKDFSSITETLRDRVENGDLSKVMPLLAQRQELIEHIDRIEEQIQKIRPKKTLKELRNRTEPVSRTIWEILKKTVALDKACAARVISWQDEIKGELIKMRKGLKAVHSYTGRLSGPPKFLDMSR